MCFSFHVMHIKSNIMTLERPKPKHSQQSLAHMQRAVALEVPATSKDEPINSRNSPTTLNVLTYSTDQEDFSNRWVFSNCKHGYTALNILCDSSTDQ